MHDFIGFADTGRCLYLLKCLFHTPVFVHLSLHFRFQEYIQKLVHLQQLPPFFDIAVSDIVCCQLGYFSLPLLPLVSVALSLRFTLLAGLEFLYVLFSLLYLNFDFLVNLILCLAGFDLLLLDVQIFVLYLILHAASLVQRTLGGIYVQLVCDQVFLHSFDDMLICFPVHRSFLEFLLDVFVLVLQVALFISVVTGSLF